MPLDLGERVAVLERGALEGRQRADSAIERMQEQLARLIGKVEELPTRKEVGALAERVAAIDARLQDLPGRKEFATQTERLTAIDARMQDLPGRKELGAVQQELAGVRGKVDNLPTWWQLAGLVGVIVVLSTAMFAFANHAVEIIDAIRRPVAVQPMALPAQPPAAPKQP